jgi:hypothetical protein
VYPATDTLVYVTCPACRRKIEEPFQRYSGPVVFVHRHGKKPPARLIVTPDPHGEDHRVQHVRNDVSLEDALVWVLKAGGL